MTAKLKRDTLTGRAWLAFEDKPDDATMAALKAAGWRWSGRRQEWHNNRRAVVPPACVAYEDAGSCDYASERADRLERAADRAAAVSEAARARADQIASFIPMGQPILVGHHSERRHRRDIGRIDGAMQKAFEEGQKADALAATAERSRRHQARMQSVGVISRRLDRLRADLRAYERTLARETGWSGEERDRYVARMDALKADIARNEEAYAAAGGIPASSPDVVVKAGDLADINGFQVLVEKVNPKTITGTIAAGGAKGHRMKWDKSRFRGVIRSA